MFMPKTLAEVYNLSKIQEAALKLNKQRGQVFNFEVVADPVDTCHDDSILEPGEDTMQEEGTWEIIEFTSQISLHALNGCTLSSTYPLKVDIPGGAQLTSKNLYKKFAWKMHREEFVVDAMVLPLGGCDMVLGVQWLSTLGNIMLNFQELRMEFKYKGRKVSLRGTRKSRVQWMKGSRVPEQTAQLSSMVLCVYPSTALNMVFATTIEGIPLPISNLLSHFDDVFYVPISLPPMREYDHKIVLKKGTEPIFSRPYRHSSTQKDA
nr:hypothetical protein [Tanacetum cinerariifolium]